MNLLRRPRKIVFGFVVVLFGLLAMLWVSASGSGTANASGALPQTGRSSASGALPQTGRSSAKAAQGVTPTPAANATPGTNPFDVLGNEDLIPPTPPSIGADIPVTYFGPSPSEVQKELIGPYLLLKAGKIDLTTVPATLTLPLYLGHMKDGTNVWYILTDTDDKPNAEALGLNFSSKLSYGNVARGARNATLEKDASLTFDSGTVDFTPERQIVPGDAPNFFPPKTANPGSIADANYSPLVRIVNSGNHIYNAPIIAFGVDAKQLAFCDGNPDYKLVHDRVAKICPGNGETAAAPSR